MANKMKVNFLTARHSTRLSNLARHIDKHALQRGRSTQILSTHRHPHTILLDKLYSETQYLLKSESFFY